MVKNIIIHLDDEPFWHKKVHEHILSQLQDAAEIRLARSREEAMDIVNGLKPDERLIAAVVDKMLPYRREEIEDRHYSTEGKRNPDAPRMSDAGFRFIKELREGFDKKHKDVLVLHVTDALSRYMPTPTAKVRFNTDPSSVSQFDERTFGLSKSALHHPAGSAAAIDLLREELKRPAAETGVQSVMQQGSTDLTPA